MRYGIFSDVHGNLEAFQTILNFYKKQDIDQFIHLGDIVGYGANPNECSELLKDLKAFLIAGNHDWAVLNKISTAYFNPYAQKAVIWTKKSLNKENFNYLNTFSLIHQENNFICLHGSLDEPGKFNYIINSAEAVVTFSLMPKKICFVGHSHRMEIFSLADNQICYSNDQAVKLKPDTKYIINVGSVGQPRDQDPRACLCIYDDQKQVVEFRRLEYNIKKTADKILNNGLPSVLAERLYLGR